MALFYKPVEGWAHVPCMLNMCCKIPNVNYSALAVSLSAPLDFLFILYLSKEVKKIHLAQQILATLLACEATDHNCNNSFVFMGCI